MPPLTALSAAGGILASSKIALIHSITDPQWFDPNQENIDL